MWRALAYLALVAAAASGAVWLANRPGELVVTWGSLRLQTTVSVAVITVVAIAVALALLWTVVRFLIDLPEQLRSGTRARRRSRGYRAVSRGMVAVGAGDHTAARRYAGEAARLLGREPLAMLLKAQAAQVTGDRMAAERAFRRMLDNSDTRVLGLRGLYMEAKRRGETEVARDYAAEAARLTPAASWASDAVLEAHAAEGDWKGALSVVERRAALGLLDKARARRDRAVLLTARAQGEAETNPDGALRAALDAAKLAPDLVPAAALAGRLLSRRGDLRKASRVIEAAWKAGPHPELAEVYINLRPGDSALDRVTRGETLAKWSSWDPEARLALASTLLEAREFARARSVLAPVLEERPTVRACLLMAEIEQAEHGPGGRSREWLARAARAPRDPAWIADGQVFDHWMPVSPISGRLDAFAWQQPPDLLGGPGPVLDDRFADEPASEVATTPAAVESLPAPREEAPAPPAGPAAAEIVAAPASPAPDAPREEQAVAAAETSPPADGLRAPGDQAPKPDGADAPAVTSPPEPDKPSATPSPHANDAEPVKRVTVRVSG